MILTSLVSSLLIGVAPPSSSGASRSSATISDPSPERIEELKSTIAKRRSFLNAEHNTANMARAEIQRELQMMAMQEAMAEAAALRAMQRSNNGRHHTNPNHYRGNGYHVPSIKVEKMPVARSPVPEEEVRPRSTGSTFSPPRPSSAIRACVPPEHRA